MDSPAKAPRPSVRGRSRTSLRVHPPVNPSPPPYIFRIGAGPVQFAAAGASDPAPSASESTPTNVAAEVVEVSTAVSSSDPALDQSTTLIKPDDVVAAEMSDMSPTSDDHEAPGAPDDIDPTSQGVAGPSVSDEVIVAEKPTAPTIPKMTKPRQSDSATPRRPKSDRANGNVKKVVEGGDAKVSPPGSPVEPEKKAVSVPLCANFFRLKMLPSWRLHAYSVRFGSKEAPPAPQSLFWKILKEHNVDIGVRFYEGNLYTSKLLKDVGIPLDMTVNLEKEGGPKVSIFMTYIGQVSPDSPVYDEIHSSLLLKCLFALGLEPIGRHFYQPKRAVKLPKLKLELWPGYITSLRRYEGGEFYLCVDPTFKVLGQENVLQVIRGIEKTGIVPSNNDNDLRRKAVINTIGEAVLMTTYNRRSYRFADIDFKMSPRDTFQYKDGPISFADYYEQRYGLKVKDLKQPLIITRASSKNLESGERTILIPELCRVVGLSDEMRKNYSVMKELAQYLDPPPTGKVSLIQTFIEGLKSNPDVRKEFQMWGLEVDDNFLDVTGRILGNQNIQFAKGPFPVNQKGTFNLALRSQQMLSTVGLKNWGIFIPRFPKVKDLMRVIRRVGNPLGMEISEPYIHILPDTQPEAYLNGIQELVARRRGLQMVLVILPDNNPEIYMAVKRRLTVELGIPSQFFLATNIDSDNIMNICSKLVVQINAKLGGEPWSVKLPLTNTMFIGFDIYKGEKGLVGAMVSTFSSNFTKYFSTTSVYGDSGEMSIKLFIDVLKCAQAYKEENDGQLPERIIMYRAGVSEPHLKKISQIELGQIKEELAKAYRAQELSPPRLTFIHVKRTTGTKLFQREPPSSYENPPLRTLVDSGITLPEPYDFYLISSGLRRGTVSPCSYQVLCDQSGLSPEKIQMTTYKMCHMYFNFNGTMAIPAPCQYAGKLAFLTAAVYAGPANDKLSKILHFL